MCGYDYLNHKPEKLPVDTIISLIDQLSELGIKSICFAGDGEPLINEATVYCAVHAKTQGVDVGLSTNGVLLTKDKAKELLPSLTWIRFSINGGTPESYAKVHQTKESDFHRVIQTLANIVEIKRHDNLQTTIGVQFVLLPENHKTVFDLARLTMQCGVDYFVVKPFYRHPSNKYNINPNFVVTNKMEYLKKVEMLTTDQFKSVVRWNTIEENSSSRRYTKCYGLPFIAIIASTGHVFPCLPHQDNNLHSFGNIKETPFKSIWDGEKRKMLMNFIDSIDKNKCQPYCRHHSINNYLWDIRNPNTHKNFI
ncbi:MAG: radical SAM protein [Nitrospirae bacterium]|nr:radical SAM protein [Nitrospirota bacterium]